MRLLYFAVLFFSGNAADNKAGPGEFARYIVDKNVVTLLEKAKNDPDDSPARSYDAFWVFADNEMLDGAVKEAGERMSDPLIYFDTLGYMSTVCDCVFKNDTVYLKGGIFYEGGIGFFVRISGNVFDAKVLLAGKNRRTKDSLNYKGTVLLNSIKQTLKIHDRNALKMDSTLIGELFMESEESFLENEITPEKYYMKLLFSCELDNVNVL